MKLMKLLFEQPITSNSVFKYKWTATKADGSTQTGISTLVGSALQDVLDLHRVVNPDKLIDIWNNKGKSTQFIKWVYEKA